MRRRRTPSRPIRTTRNLPRSRTATPTCSRPGPRRLLELRLRPARPRLTKAAGKPFADLLSERLLDPLGMEDTMFNPPAEREDR